VRHGLLLPNRERFTELKRKDKPDEFSHADRVLEDPAAHQTGGRSLSAGDEIGTYCLCLKLRPWRDAFQRRSLLLKAESRSSSAANSRICDFKGKGRRGG
jgi:hypothetical protein